MAERPVFVPVLQGAGRVTEVQVSFPWHPGFSPSQKRKNVEALHAAAATKGLNQILEVSTKSDRLIGKRLSAFHQRIILQFGTFPLESVYQGSKVFEDGGPFIDVFDMTPLNAKRDERLSSSGNLVAFELEGQRFPLVPPTAFYDWLYLRCLFPEREWLRRLHKLDGFTDIEFNPSRSINCQARSCALFVSLDDRGILNEAMSSFDAFVEAGGNSL